MATFTYDTYGKLLSRTGRFKPIFLYNGRDGVVTDPNGLLYMRARYYSPELRRFMNADLLAGDISDARTLNRYSYVCGDPVSFVDPFGLEAEHGDHINLLIDFEWEKFVDEYFLCGAGIGFTLSDDRLTELYNALMRELILKERPANIGKGIWAKILSKVLSLLDEFVSFGKKIL